jgi:putative ABC transport system permease protein
VSGFLGDLRYAIRSLGKSRGLTAVAVLVLAIGVGANTALFSAVDAALLEALPYPGADRLVSVYTTARSDPSERLGISPADYLDWRARSASFEALAAYRGWNFSLGGSDGAERVEGAVVAAGLFPLLGVAPERGRAFAASEEGSGERAAVLSHGLWTRRFGGDPGVVGRSVRLNGEPFVVRGIMPDAFRFPAGAELWVLPRRRVPESPLDPAGEKSEERGHGYLDVVGRLRPGVSLAAARAEMDAVARRIERENPSTNMDSGVRLTPLREDLVGAARPTLLVLLAAVGLVLLVACGNVGALLAARATSREAEIAVRVSLGATPRRLVRQLLTESAVLGLAGGALGMVVAVWGVGPLATLVPAGLPSPAEVGASAPVLAFTLVLSLATSLLFGLLPAFQSSRVAPATRLREGARSTRTAWSRGAGGFLVAGEIALSALLATGAVLLLRSYARLQDVDPGFDARGVLTAQLALPAATYGEPDKRAAFVADVLERARALPGVEAAGAVSRLPLRPGNSSRTLQLEGESPARTADADFRVATPGYFTAMKIPLLAGRDFDEADRAGRPGVAVVNRALAGLAWPGRDPLGRRISIPDEGGELEVVGVVGDVRHAALAEEPNPEVYVAFAQDPWPFFTFTLRSATGAAGLAPALRDLVHDADPDQALSQVRTLPGVVEDSLARRRLAARVLGLFAGVALLLAALGVYGILSYSVSRRSREIGVRMALGARRADVFGLVLRQGLLLTVAGLGAGLLLALALTRVLASQLYGLSARDPVTYIAVGALLVSAGVAAASVPARRLASADPLTVLRSE